MQDGFPMLPAEMLARLREGLVIPAHPLAVNATGGLDERHQRALTRYYLAAGAGGLAVGVHTTEFRIHEPKVGLYGPVLELAMHTARSFRPAADALMVAGLVGRTEQAVREAGLARELGYQLGLLSLGALRDVDDQALVEHIREVARVMPLMGFYLQPLAGGRLLSRAFWRETAAIPNLCAIKIAPFNRYQTLDVVHGVAESGRAGDIALYTGNDDNILVDLLTSFEVPRPGGTVRTAIVGGLLGHWAYWTRNAVGLLEQAREARERSSIPAGLLTLAAQITETNAAVFDPEHAFTGCLSGILYALQRNGLVGGVRCLDERERLSAGQAARIEQVVQDYPLLVDDGFVRENRASWLAP
jgi:hypothetical protein